MVVRLKRLSLVLKTTFSKTEYLVVQSSYSLRHRAALTSVAMAMKNNFVIS